MAWFIIRVVFIMIMDEVAAITKENCALDEEKKTLNYEGKWSLKFAIYAGWRMHEYIGSLF